MNSTSPDPTAPDLFALVYCPRSGSTFLANQLAHHRQIGMLPETNFVRRLIDAYGARGHILNCSTAVKVMYSCPKFSNLSLTRRKLLDRLRTIKDGEQTLPVRDAVLEVFRIYHEAHHADARYLGLKKDTYLYCADVLKHWFPNVQLLHIVRDPRAVCNSQMQSTHSQTGQPFTESPIRFSYEWNRTIRTFRSFQSDHPRDCMEVSYEALIRKREQTLDKICSWLRVADQDESVEHTASDSTKQLIPEDQAHLHEKVDQDPDPQRILAWRSELSREAIYTIESVLYPTMRKLGYSLLTDAAGHRARVRYFLYTLLQHVKTAVKSQLSSKNTRCLKQLVKRFLVES